MSNTLLEPTVEVLPAETQEERDQLAAYVAKSGLDMESAHSLQAAFADMFTQAEEWRAKAAAIKVTDASQTREIKLARETRLALKDIRVKAEKTRKALKEDSLRRGKAIDGIANVLKFLIEPVEEHLLEQEKFVERQEAERIAKLEAERTELLALWLEEGAPPPPNLGQMTEEQFAALRDGTKAQFEARREAERKAEEERIAREKAEAEERKRIEEENARLKAEADAAAEALRLEREAAEAARAEQERIAAAKLAEEQAKAKVEREKIEEQARIEREAAEAIAERERARAAEIEAQREAELEAERIRQEEEAEALRKAAAAPDREKLQALINQISGISMPELVTEEAIDALKAFVLNVDEAIATLSDEIGKL